MITLDAILLGGGTGDRFSALSNIKYPKQYQLLGDRPVFIHALQAFLSLNCFRQIVITAPETFLSSAREMLDGQPIETTKTRIRIVAGGRTRQESGRLALEAIQELSPKPERILIHDACRPFLSNAFLKRIYEKLLDSTYSALVPVVPVIETLKRTKNQEVVKTVDRSHLQRAQTPQIFDFQTIHTLSQKAASLPETHFTDDASVCEYFGVPVKTFEGDIHNIKLTYPYEFEILQNLINQDLTAGRRKDSCPPESDTTFTV